MSYRDKVSNISVPEQIARIDKELAFEYALTAVISILVLVPLIVLITQAFSSTPVIQEFTLDVTLSNFRELASERGFWNALSNTLKFAIGVVIGSHILGFILAFILTRMDIPFREKFHVLMYLPIFVSSLVLAVGYSFSFLRGGPYRQALSSLGIEISVNNVRGMILVGIIWLTPYAYTFISAGLQNVDPEMEYAAEIAGASSWKALFSISLPLLKPFILSSMLLTGLLAFEAISIPVIMGLPDSVYVLSTYLYAQEAGTIPPPYGKMAVIGLFMIAITAIGAFVIQFLIGDVRQYTTITGTSRERSIETTLPGKIIALAFLLIYLSFFIVIPLFVIMSVALTGSSQVAFTLENISFEWLMGVAETEILTLAIKNTLLIASITATVSVLVTGIISYIVNRIGGRISLGLNILAWIPIATPGVVLGISYLWAVLLFVDVLYGTIVVLMLAFFTRFLAVGVRMNNSLISQQSKELDEQAFVCGAGLFDRLGKIVFPNAKNGMLSIWVILFVAFMGELSTSIFLYTSSSRVISVTIFELWYTAQMGSLAALSLTLMVITLSAVFIVTWAFDVDIRAM